MKELDLK